MNGEESTCGVTEPLIGASEPPGSVQCSVCKAITAPGNGCSAEDCPVGVDASDEALALEALPVAHLRSLTHPDWLEVCGKDEPGAFPVFASHEALRRSIAAAAGVVVDHHQGPKPSDADASKDRP